MRTPEIVALATDARWTHMARQERRKTGVLIATYAALAVLGLALSTPGPVVIGFAIANGFAWGRFLRLSDLIDDADRRTRHLN